MQVMIFSKNNFNSIKVQLKRNTFIRPTIIDKQFQFHKGTIKATIAAP